MSAARAVLSLLLAPALVAAAPGTGSRAVPAGRAPLCTGEYADFLSSLRAEARAFEASPEASYTYCIRTVATYEHISYAKGGRIRRDYVRHVRHGTGFAYRAKDGESYVATNEHVTVHPDVTETDSDVDGVPAGSRKVREVVRIVRNEADDWEPGQIPLTPVVSDEALDVAILKTRQPLKLLPYRIGRSAGLRIGNAVLVRGYPLGAFAASNSGKVISVAQPDRERGWAHDDFAVDALLNPGNSGSPVLAVSCRTGEPELVGIYHAGYRDAQGLNVVVSVDQLREMLETLRVPPRPPAASEPPLDPAGALAAVRAAPPPFLMPFGGRTVRVEPAGAGLRFALLDADFPLGAGVAVAFTSDGRDLAAPSALLLPQRLGRVPVAWRSLDASMRDEGQRLYDALWRQLADVLRYRAEQARAATGPDALAALGGIADRIRARDGEQRELLDGVDFQSGALAAPDPRPRPTPPAGSSPAVPPDRDGVRQQAPHAPAAGSIPHPGTLD